MSGWRAPERIFVGMGVTFDAATWAWYLAAIVWWTVDLGYGPLQLVLLGTVLEVTALVTEVPTGMVADRVSRKWSVVSSYAMMSTAMMLSAATRDYGVMLAAQALFGLGWTFRSGAATWPGSPTSAPHYDGSRARAMPKPSTNHLRSFDGTGSASPPASLRSCRSSCGAITRCAA